jgi:hydroxyacid-oxoacid transhydrogenase
VIQQQNRALVGDVGGSSLSSDSSQREFAYEIKASSFKYGLGVIRELGLDARHLRMRKVVVFTDRTVRGLPFFASAIAALKSTMVSVLVFDEVAVEPTDRSCEAAAAFLRDAVARDACDGVVSIGGGSVMDTLKIANLLAVHGGSLRDWTNAPIGAGRVPDRALLPHIAVPTTCGTGAEQTGLAIYDLTSINAKTGVGNWAIKPDRAVIDPEAVWSLPAAVVAASGFDTLSHSIESYTARPFSQRSMPRDGVRPAAQGSTPYTDIGCLAALEIVGLHLPQAVLGDRTALERMVFASTLAGTAINGAGCTAPHALSYSISSMNKQIKWQPRGAGWPASPIVPHGFAVALTAPACFKHNASTNPERHLRCAQLLDPKNELNTRSATPDQAGEALRLAVISMMRRNQMPSGLAEIGYGEAHVSDLVKGALPQRRLLDNNPRPLDADAIARIYRESFKVF